MVAAKQFQELVIFHLLGKLHIAKCYWKSLIKLKMFAGACCNKPCTPHSYMYTMVKRVWTAEIASTGLCLQTFCVINRQNNVAATRFKISACFVEYNFNELGSININ